MDITDTIAAKSDQLNADDLIGGARTVTIAKVSRGDPDQPVHVTTAEFGDDRPYKPCKSMRRVLVAAWGPDATAYVGRRMTLYRDDKVKFGGQDVGGIRISHMSDLAKQLKVALLVTRGKRALFVIEPLPDAAGLTQSEVADIEKRIASASTGEELDAVAKFLKSLDLGSHRRGILAAWSARRDALSQAVDEAPAESIPATKEQLAQLDSIRQMEKYDENEWMAFLRDTAGISVDKLADLTSAQAATVIGMFQGDGHPA